MGGTGTDAQYSDERADMRIILASGSSFRKALLEQKGIAFTVRKPPEGCEEKVPLGRRLCSAVKRRAQVKAYAVASLVSDGIIIGADTIVVDADGEPIGKPLTMKKCRSYFERLNGKVFRVLTAACVIKKPGNISVTRHWVSVLKMKHISKKELSRMTGLSDMTKAGGYSLKENDPYFTLIQGSWDTAKGLSGRGIISMLRKLRADILK